MMKIFFSLNSFRGYKSAFQESSEEYSKLKIKIWDFFHLGTFSCFLTSIKLCWFRLFELGIKGVLWVVDTNCFDSIWRKLVFLQQPILKSCQHPPYNVHRDAINCTIISAPPTYQCPNGSQENIDKNMIYCHFVLKLGFAYIAITHIKME